MKWTLYIKGCLLCGVLIVATECEAQHFVGVREGVSMSSVQFNPSRDDTSTFQTLNVGVVYKYYSRKWVGFQSGLTYAEKGYKLGDTTFRYSVLEFPFLTQFHMEIWKFRLIAHGGLYASYFLELNKHYHIAEGKEEEKKFDFDGRDNRFEYGMHFGGGLALMFDPFEIQFEANYQYGLSYLKKPTYESKSIMFTHFTQMIFSAAVLFKL
ncbi:MAG: PorT family protein [Prevotellaceae bacterium]|jgi:hypothetical protein|nr:PorT family protein [Prevotellaceae bacterium]